MRGHQAVGEQVQAQVGVRGVPRRRVEVDLGAHHLGAHAARGVLAPGRHQRRPAGRGGPVCGGGPSVGAGYQTSRTVSPATVASPWPQAVRVMSAA